MSTSRIERASLAAILCIAALVRFWGLDFGLPQTQCRPDEALVVQPALEYFGGDLDPHFFRYPSLASYLVFGEAAVYYAFGRLSGRFTSLDDLRFDYLVDPSPFHLLARGLSASFGVATVWIVFRIARRWYGRDVALAAAALLALCHLHARDSHFGVTDVMETFFIALAFERIQAWWSDGARGAAIGAGVATGLAASSKYVGGLMLVPFVIAAVLRVREDRSRARSALGAALAFGAAALLAFVAGTPYSVLDFPTFLSQLGKEFSHLEGGHFLDLGRGWTRHPSFSLWHGQGPPVFVASLIGAVVLFVLDERRAACFFSFPLAYFALAGFGSTVFVRYAIPWTPFVSICASAIVVAAAQFVASGARRGAIIVFATLALAAPSIQSIVRTDLALGRTDSRELAARWIEQHVAPGSAIAQLSNFGRVQLPASEEARARTLALYLEPNRRDTPDAIEARVARLRRDPTRTREGEGYVACRWRARDARFVREGSEPCDPPQYILVSTSPLSVYDAVPPQVQALLTAEYAPLWSVATGARGVAEARYDAIDAFYLPFAIPGGIERPGPDLVLYERR